MPPAGRICWTNAQLQWIGRALRKGDRAFLAAVEAAVREAFERALTPPRG
jgi:hypothetical protein